MPTTTSTNTSQTVPVGGNQISPSAQTQPVSGMTAKVKFLENIVTLMVVVLFIGFLAGLISILVLWVQSFSEKSASYQQLQTQIATQNAKLETLTAEITNLNFTIQQLKTDR